jgi:hypothetical protein
VATTLPADYSPAPAGHGGLPTPHSRFGLFLPAALLPNGSLLRRLRDASEPLFVTNTQLLASTVAPQVEEAAAVEVQLRSAGPSGVWTPVSNARRMNVVVLFPMLSRFRHCHGFTGQVLPLLSSLNQLMQTYISSGQAPPSAAVQGRLTQLGVEDDGICVIGIL